MMLPKRSVLVPPLRTLLPIGRSLLHPTLLEMMIGSKIRAAAMIRRNDSLPMTLLAVMRTLMIKVVVVSIATRGQAEEMTMMTAAMEIVHLDETLPLRPDAIPHATNPIDAETIATQENIETRETTTTLEARVTRETIAATTPRHQEGRMAAETTIIEGTVAHEMTMTTRGETIDVEMETTKSEEETILPPEAVVTALNPTNTETTVLYMIIDDKVANRTTLNNTNTRLNFSPFFPPFQSKVSRISWRIDYNLG